MEEDVATIRELQTQLDTLVIERDQLFQKRKPIEEALSLNYDTISKIKEEIASIKKETGFSVEDMLHYDPQTETAVLYNEKRAFFEKHGLHQSGYLPATEKNGVFQSGFEVQFYKDKSPDGLSVPQQIDQVVDFINKYKDKILRFKDNTIYIGVFEHTLSEYGVYSINVNPESDKATLTKTTYGHSSVLFEGTFRGVLEIIARDHYYE